MGPEPASAQDATGPIQFRVSLDGALGATPVSGRLLIYMTVNDKPLEVIEPGFGSEVKNVWIIAREVQSLAPGAEVVLDVGDPTYPQPLTHAPAADYQVMALLDVDHNAAYTRSTEADVRSRVIKLSGLNPSAASPHRVAPVGARRAAVSPTA